MEYSRKEQEQMFHDQRELDRKTLPSKEFKKKYSNKGNYVITRKSIQHIENFLKKEAKGKAVLDYCCGLGENSLRLAQSGASKVFSIDISTESLKTTSELLSANGYSASHLAQVMDAEDLTFPKNFFDLIICCGCLHHLDLDKAYRELHKVLKKDGKIICVEALGHNPFINLYRRLTPTMRTAWEADHILKLKDINKAGKYFSRINISFWHLASIAAIPFKNFPVFKLILVMGEALDSILMKLPFIKNMAWQCVFILSGPKDDEIK